METTIENKIQAEIWTEGKTDWMILKKAKEVLGIKQAISFHESMKDMGSDKLLKSIQTFSEKENPYPLVFIFDHDENSIVSQVSGQNNLFKDWGNNVFSFAIPIPPHRMGQNSICIEMYFQDEDLFKTNPEGRRFFLTSEFNEITGRHKNDTQISYSRVSFLKSSSDSQNVRIIDSCVYNASNTELAMSKSEFANLVSDKKEPFDSPDFSAFLLIFQSIEEIINSAQQNSSMFFPDLPRLFDSITKLEKSKQFNLLFQTLKDLISVALQLFSISVIRCYEQEIITDSINFRKRVIPLKNILNESFRKPNISILLELAEKCFYLAAADAPPKLNEMKNCLASVVVLEALGDMIDHLELLFCIDLSKGQLLNKREARWELLRRILPEFAKYLDKPDDVIVQALNSVVDCPDITISVWEDAIVRFVKLFSPLFSSVLIFRKIINRDPISDEYINEIRTYDQGSISISRDRLQRTDDDFESKTFTLILANNLHIPIFPMLLIHDDSLFYYRRTLTRGFEYYSPIKREVYIEQTRRKFNHILFQSGSEQELFWTNVLPKTNPDNGVRSNIPDEGPLEFIGRRKLINQIKEEVISIVNENCILYGPGGIGKTALMIQLSKEIYEEKNLDNIQFNNVIWVSAKNTYYDYIHDSIEPVEPQVKTLDGILIAILAFFDIGDLLEYSIEDLKDLTIEVLKENKVLLILDNFETIQKDEGRKVIEYFGTQVKIRLRHYPGNFKVILTSRELDPSGFKQIELNGLDLRDSKKLMVSLYKRYKSSQKNDLTDEQKENLHTNTKGIPILIKHCYAKIFEYNEPIETVIRNLSNLTGNIVQFSFKEILQRIEKDTTRVELKILILMEIVDIPLMIRQMTDILEIDQTVIEAKIPLLANFECLKSSNIENQEKYYLNDEIRLLTKSLAQNNRELVQEIRRKYYRNFSFDRQMDYTSEEADIISIFDGYIKNQEYADAGNFIERELKKHTQSILLNYYYAKYLKDRRNDIEKAIQILEILRKTSRNHPSVLRLLFNCYTSPLKPNYERAEILVNQIKVELGEYLEQEPALQMEIARFYVKWSISIKVSKGIDPYEDQQRVGRYKEFAQQAIDILNPIEKEFSNNLTFTNRGFRLHEVYYRLGQCFYNLWDYDQAIFNTKRAIGLANNEMDYSSQLEYEGFLNKYILKNKEFYEKNSWHDHR
jgi:DNA polymerase III delta prime subunit